MFKRLLSVGGFTLLSRVTGFCRDVLMAAALGNGPVSDAFFVAFRFPNYFRAIFGEGTINPAFLPRYAALRVKGEGGAAAEFANRVFSWQMTAQLAILIAALAAMPYVIRIVAPGFLDNPGQLALAANLSRITFPYLILTVVTVQLSAMLNAHDKFWAAAAWSNFLNLAMICAILAAPWFPNAAYAAAWGVLAGGILQLIFILWAAAREGVRLRIVRPRWTPQMREFFAAFGAVTLGAASYTIAPFVDTLIASFLPTGSLTALYYADRINQLPLGVLGIALGTVLLPEMSARLAQGDRAGSDAAQNRAAALGLFLTLPFAAMFFVIPDVIMRAVFEHGAFDRHAADLSAIALAAYGVGLPAFVLVRITASTFYARHDTATPARATVIAMTANIAMKAIFVWGFHLGVAGIALGTALGAWINVGQLVWVGRKRGLLNVESGFRRAIVPIVLAAAAAALGAYVGASLGQMLHAGRYQQELRLLFGLVLAGAGYGAVTLAFRRVLPLGRLAKAAA